MKKLFLVLLVLMVTVSVHAFTWHLPNQSTVGWDAEPAPSEGQTMTYKVYLAPKGAVDAKQLIDEIPGTVYTITFPAVNGLYIAGVSTVLHQDGDSYESGINWSDVDLPEGSTPAPFGWPLIKPPSNLAVQ